MQENPFLLKSAFKKNKTYTHISQPILSSQLKQQQRIPINDIHDQSILKKPIYYMPKWAIDPQNHVFNPSKWSIDNFEIGRPLGSGKFGHVYLARQKKTSHIVALKVLSKKQIINSQIINQVRRQIQIHTHLKHPNILAMYGFFYDRKRLYYILQYAPGGQLYKKFTKAGYFQEKVSSNYILQIAHALKCMHQMEVVHRDIKPQNILISYTPQGKQVLKIADFGWSIHNPNSKRRTMCGTLDYLCPQLVENKPHDNRVDIWTLGILAYQLSSGKPPFESSSRYELFEKIKNVKLNFPQHFSMQLRDFLNAILKRNPAQRLSIEHIIKHPWLTKYKQCNNQKMNFQYPIEQFDKQSCNSYQ